MEEQEKKQMIHISITNELWLILNRLKEPADSFEDVIWRLYTHKQLNPGNCLFPNEQNKTENPVC